MLGALYGIKKIRGLTPVFSWGQADVNGATNIADPCPGREPFKRTHGWR